MQAFVIHPESHFVMVRAIFEEQITPPDAVARKILEPKEVSLVSSITKIGAGGVGDIYKMSLRRFLTDDELKGSHWEAQGHVRKVRIPLCYYH